MKHLITVNDKQQIEYLEWESGPEPSWTIIWLHGLGADGHDFEPVAPQLGFSDTPSVRFIFPHAPIRPITINDGMEMRGWYDIKGMAFDREEDRAGIEESASIVSQLIKYENQRGIETNKIVVAGFSQGGAIALFCGLRFPQPLAAIVALSSYLPDAASLERERSSTNQAVPIFMAHGTQDPVVPLMLAERSRQQLDQMQYDIEWHTYDMPHSVNTQELQDIARFLHNIIKEP
jgi:phospholipase/carboxylesterase